MFYEQDWVMKQIRILVMFVAKVVFGKDTAEYKKLVENNLTDADEIHLEITTLLSEGKICQAENLLFANLDTSKKEHLALAVDFYARVNELSDSELEEDDFSREEVKDGIRNIMQMFSLDFGDEFLD